MSLKRKFGLSGNALKIIAITSMLIDHIGAVHLIDGYYFQFRLIGRIAFPIFCFLLSEGFIHTSNIKKYASNLFIFALISEIPFDMTFLNSPFDWSHQNVYFTLFLGLITLYFMNLVRNDSVKLFSVIAGGSLLAEFLRTDYGAIGVIMIVMFYELRSRNSLKLILLSVLAGISSASLYLAAAIGVLITGLYNGERGRFNCKYFFYWFYPAHIVVLLFICYFKK